MNLRALCIACLAAVLVVGLCQFSLVTSYSYAQEEGAAVNPPAAAAPAGEPAASPPQQQSSVVWFLVTIGLIGYFLFALSMYLVALIARMFAEIRPQMAMPPALVDNCDQLLQDKQFKEIFNVVGADESLYAKLLAKGIAELPTGLAEARDVMERHEEALRSEMERKISPMAVLGTLGPMIGLLGTLKGMIASFSSIAGGTTVKSDEVAKGISEALLLTLLGVGLSVPAIYFYSFFRNRIIGITTTTSLAADDFLRHFAHAARANRPNAAAAKGGGTPPSPG